MSGLSTDQLIDFILEHTSVPGLTRDDVAAADQLLTGGLIDSLGLLQLVEAIEAAVGLTMNPSDISIAHFNALAAIERLQARLLANRPAASA